MGPYNRLNRPPNALAMSSWIAELSSASGQAARAGLAELSSAIRGVGQCFSTPAVIAPQRRILFALGLMLGLSGPLYADPVPLDDNLQPVGSGHLSWWGIGVYDATLYSDDGRYRPQRPHALRIDYQISVTAAKLAERSLDEIEAIFGEQPERQRMMASLQALFCDVEDGDTIIGYHYPGEGAEFYCNGERIGRLEDAKLAEAFFAIWLHPRTSEPKLRRQLLGESS